MIVVAHCGFANVLIHWNIVLIQVWQAFILLCICGSLTSSSRKFQARNVALEPEFGLLKVVTYGGTSIPKSKPKSTG